MTDDTEKTLSADFDKAVAAAEVFMAALNGTSAAGDGVGGKITLAVNALHNVAYREDPTQPNVFMVGLTMGLATIFSGAGMSTGLARKQMVQMSGLMVRTMNAIGRRRANG